MAEELLTTNAPIGKNGKPMVAIVGGVKESLPHDPGEKNTAWVTIGPIAVVKWIEDEGDKKISKAIEDTQKLVEQVAGEHRTKVLDKLGV